MGVDTGVMEMQGLYGPYFVTEQLIQQLWGRGDYERSRACTEEGDTVEVLHPGRWNRLGGPDFLDARLRIRGVVTTGDVEVHAHEEEWRRHGHGNDPAYANVILHVVLFPPSCRRTESTAGRSLPVLCLLPLLLRDLEDYAADSVVERLAAHPLLWAHEGLSGLDRPTARRVLATAARERWERKRCRARDRVASVGWDQACHCAALELLGARANRGGMRALAEAHPLAHWREWARGTSWPWEALEAAGGAWVRQGVRPGNRPELRVKQYARWISEVPEWPAKLRGWEPPKVAGFDDVSGWRKAAGWGRRRTALLGLITGGAVGGTRQDTLLCDVFLPLLAAERVDDAELFYQTWFATFPGDVPDDYLDLLRSLQVIGAPGGPSANGWVQGLMGWLAGQNATLASFLRAGT